MSLLIGKKIYRLAKKLFPINRSITGEGNRKTLKTIKSIIKNLKIKEYKSGQKVFDWQVPNEWNVKEAFVKYKDKKIIDFEKNNLHLVGYSAPVKKFVKKKELFKHIHTYKRNKNVIPYITSYYKKYWGFCVSENFKKKIKGNKFYVNIDSSFKKNGSLTIGELFIKGKTKYEVLLSCNICHPSLANNELSGPTVLTFLAKFLNNKKNNYSYRILFMPETIGSITYLSKKLDYLKKNFIAGFHLTCIGDKGNFSIVETPNKNSYSDKISKEIISKYDKSNIYKFTHCGSDERQFNYPGIDLPVVTISRSLFGEYKEYHTSDDNLEFIDDKSLGKSYEFIKKIINKIEKNYNYDFRIFANTKCEPFLSKRNLYRTISNNLSILSYHEKLLFNVLYYSDGRRISDIQKELKCNKKNLMKVIGLLHKNKLIRKLN
jgi:aminopeptidase-like protein